MKATLDDLYSPWYGTRELLLDGKNPYSLEVTHKIQTAFYGHDLAPQNLSATQPVDEQRFAYPIYVVLLLAPVARLQFGQAQAVARIIMALAIVANVWFWLSTLRWRRNAIEYLTVTVFVLASPQVAQGLRLHQLGLIVALLFALGIWLVVRSSLTAGGAVLALATIKPQMVALPIAWLLLWSLADLRRRWRLPAGLLAGLAILLGVGQWILPGWAHDFVAGLVAYRRYGPVTSLLQLVFGDVGGMIAGILIVAGLLAWNWGRRQCLPESQEFVGLLSSVLLVSSLASPLMPPFNQILLLLPSLLFVKHWGTKPRSAKAVFATFICWPVAAQLVLLVIPLKIRSTRPVPLLPSALVLTFPFVLTALQVLTRKHTVADGSQPEHVSH